jgi:hypothetical protein
MRCIYKNELYYKIKMLFQPNRISVDKINFAVAQHSYAFWLIMKPSSGYIVRQV